MKQKFTLLLIAVATLLFASCEKEKNDDVKNVDLNVTVQANATYTLNLSTYGDADDNATITKQGAAYNISEIAKATGTIGTYSYQANTAKGATTDVVELTVAEGKNSRCGNGNNSEKQHGDKTIITIHFTIQ